MIIDNIIMSVINEVDNNNELKSFTKTFFYRIYDDSLNEKISSVWIEDVIEEIDEILEIFNENYQTDITLLLKFKNKIVNYNQIGLEKAIEELLP